MDQNQNGEQLASGQAGPVVKYGFLHATATVPDGADIPSWHGVWAYDHASQQAHTAVVVLNLIFAIVFAMVKWVKYGGMNVAADPRQAFVDGLNAGYNEAVESLPKEIQEERQKVLGARSGLESHFRRIQRVMSIHSIAMNLAAQLRGFEANAEADIGSIVANLHNVGESFENALKAALADFDYVKLVREEQADAVADLDGGGVAKQPE